MIEGGFNPGGFRRAVWEVEQAPTARFVALVLSVLADESGFVMRPVFRVADITGFSVRTVQRVLSRLVRAGLIQMFGLRFGAVLLIGCAGSEVE